MGAVSRLARKMPGPLRRLYYASVPFSVRYGSEFRETSKFLSRSQWWGRQELEAHQLEQLGRLLEHAYTNVPYYQKVFNERGLKPRDIQSLADLSKLPILTRDIIWENFDGLIATNVQREGLKKFSTSGSTGNRLTFLGEDILYKAEAAYVARAFSAHGSKLNDEMSIWLRRYVPDDGGSIFKHDLELRRLYLSAYHLSLNRLKEYVDLINGCQARVLVGYPSSLYILASLLEGSGLRLTNVRVAHAASEQMLAHWRQKIETVLGIPVKAHYGMIEKVSMFFQCDCSDFYHESLEYGVTEFVNPEHGVGQVVGTGFLNYAMPFIRYQMNDTARVNAGETKCKCGRGLPLSVEDFEGRADDILVTSDGRYLPGVNFYTMMYKTPGVKMFQIMQQAPDSVEVLVVPSDTFDDTSMQLLRKGLTDRLGSVTLEIKLVNDIERSRQTGKIRCIINNCKLALQ